MSSIRERKLEIFIGSTREDLKAAREAVIRAVLEAGHIPSGMELWSAGVAPTQAGVLDYLHRCDLHIVILGARYGYVPPGDSISFVEWEFTQSQEAGRNVLAFLLEDREFNESLKKELSKIKDLSEREKTKKAILTFREKLKASRICRFFSNTAAGRMNLARLCSNAVVDLIARGKLPDNAGWMRADEEDAETVRQVRKNPFLNRILTRLHQFSTLTERIVEDKDAKEALATVFWDVMTGRIKRNDFRRIFFESGSTLAYLSDHFESHVVPHITQPTRWHVTTNNALTQFQLMLHTNIRVTPVPAVAPDPKDKYGAIFVLEQHAAREPCPRKPRRLYPREKELVVMLSKLLKKAHDLPDDRANKQKKTEKTQRQVFLAATSGLDLNHKEVHFRGPHVGSHANMIFKRAIFATEAPVILLLCAKKLGDRFKVGKCFPVFGPDLAWKEVLRKVPLAICVGYARPEVALASDASEKEKDREKWEPTIVSDILSKLKMLGLDETYADGFTEKGGAIIGANERFQAEFPRE